MKISEIQNRIYSDFAAIYKNAAPFVNSGPLWNFCMSVISNPVQLQNVIFANDLGVPPVKSLLNIYEKAYKPVQGFTFTAQQSRWLGALMGFLFKFVLGYRQQKERNSVYMLGVGTATKFFDKSFDFEITDD